jgi:hypothetical protein
MYAVKGDGTELADADSRPCFFFGIVPNNESCKPWKSNQFKMPWKVQSKTDEIHVLCSEMPTAKGAGSQVDHIFRDLASEEM